MDLDPRLWLTLLVRWVHVFASILWVGTTYYFTWLDGRFSELEKQHAAEGGAADASAQMADKMRELARNQFRLFHVFDPRRLGRDEGVG